MGEVNPESEHMTKLNFCLGWDSTSLGRYNNTSMSHVHKQHVESRQSQLDDLKETRVLIIAKLGLETTK